MATLSRVVAGAYKGKPLGGIFGKIHITIGFKKKVEINNDTVRKYEIENENPKTQKSLVRIEWKDGKKSLIECDSRIVRVIAQNCFE